MRQIVKIGVTMMAWYMYVPVFACGRVFLTSFELESELKPGLFFTLLYDGERKEGSRAGIIHKIKIWGRSSLYIIAGMYNTYLRLCPVIRCCYRQYYS